MVEVGDVLAGKYLVERVIGKGGMGYVLAATHVQLEQRVAVKFLMPELCEKEEAVARFLREARAAVRIQSDHVARVLDVGTLDDSTPYMVMEYLEGHDLSQEVEQRNHLPMAEAVDYVLQACEAIAEAHALGIVHRDLKPANLFKTRRADGSPFIKVLDFGISKALEVGGIGPAVPLTATQGLMGSPHYMSPEQVRRPKEVDGRSDIWSLGVILYELLDGVPPFMSDTPMSILAAVVSDPPPPLRSSRPELPAGIEEVILKCLSKNVTLRYQSIFDFATALRPYAPLTAPATISRISGILRSTKRRSITPATPTTPSAGWQAEAPTLDSAGAAPPPRVQQALKNTGDSGWGNSQRIAGRSRRRLLVAVAALAVAAGSLAIIWRFSLPRMVEAVREAAPEAGATGEPSGRAFTDPVRAAPPPAIVSASLPPPDAPAIAIGEADATIRVGQTSPAESVAPLASAKVSHARPSTAPAKPPPPARPAPPADKPAPAAKPPSGSSVDLLDGRH